MNLISVKQRYISFVTFLADHYFRAKLIFRGESTRNLHQGKPVIFISNHSGMNYPWDNIVLYVLVTRFFGPTFKLMPLATASIFSRILQPFAISGFWEMFSSLASGKNFEAMAAAGYNILINPEGIGGIAKGFNKKYRLQPYASSFVRVALKEDREIVPIYVINGEYLNPFAYTLNWINRLGQNIGIPYLPVGLLTPLYLLFPFALYISLPARLRYVFGKKIDLKKFCTKPVDQMSVEELRAVAEKVRVIMQWELDGFVPEFGQEKFAMRELFAEFREMGSASLDLLPFAWPFHFHHIESGEARGMRFSSWIACTAMLIPLVGWPIFGLYLALSRKEKTQLNINAARPLDLGKVA